MLGGEGYTDLRRRGLVLMAFFSLLIFFPLM